METNWQFFFRKAILHNYFTSEENGFLHAQARHVHPHAMQDHAHACVIDAHFMHAHAVHSTF